MINSDTPNSLARRAKMDLTSSSSLLPGNSASTSSVVMPSLRPWITGVTDIVSGQLPPDCPVEASTGGEFWLLAVFPFKGVAGDADLYAVQAIEDASRNNPIPKATFMAGSLHDPKENRQRNPTPAVLSLA